MIHDQVIRFFREIPPFSFLSQGEQRALAHAVHLEFFPQGTTLPISSDVHVLKKGWVRSEIQAIGPKECFTPTPDSPAFTAQEDLLCYQVAPDFISGMLLDHPELQIFFTGRLDRFATDHALMALRSVRSHGAWDEHPLYSTSAGDAVDSAFVMASPDISIGTAAQLMTSMRRSAIVLVDAAGQPIGICTDRDYRARVATQAVSLDQPVSEVMSMPVATATAESNCFDVLLDMTRRNVHHMVIMEEERIKGVLSNHDLLVLQGGSPLAFREKIATAQSLTELSEIARQTNALGMMLLKDGAKVASLTRIMGELFERMMVRIAEMAEEILGTPPVPYALIVFGSWARREAGARGPQQNGLIYADPFSLHQERHAEEYFHQLAVFFHDGLMGLGFASHGGGQMAVNARFRRQLSTWKFMLRDAVHGKRNDQNPIHVLDFRPIHGEKNLSDSLHEFVRAEIQSATNFETRQFNAFKETSIPQGFSSRHLLDAASKHETLSAITYLESLTALIATLSLRNNTQAASSIARLKLLGTHPLLRDIDTEMEHALEFLILFTMRHQLEQSYLPSAGMGVPISELSPQEKRTFSTIFFLLRTLAERMRSAEETAHA